jgi:hypothetical protein
LMWYSPWSTMSSLPIISFLLCIINRSPQLGSFVYCLRNMSVPGEFSKKNVNPHLVFIAAHIFASHSS